MKNTPALSETTNHEQRTTNVLVCRNCGHDATPANPSDPHCDSCGHAICIGCGCTEYTACFDGLDEGSCFWIRPGQCSACPDTQQSSPPSTVACFSNTGTPFVPERGVAAASADGVVVSYAGPNPFGPRRGAI